MAPLRIAIAGGGPGALAVAHTLIRCGFGPKTIKVFERAPHYSPAAGGGFGLAGNGSAVLHALGMSKTLDEIVSPIKNWALGDGSGHVVQRYRNVEALLGPDGSSWFGGCLRAEILSSMAQSLPPGVVQCGREVIAVNHGSSSSPALVEVADVTTGETMDVEEFDVVIAADGISSKVSCLSRTLSVYSVHAGSPCPRRGGCSGNRKFFSFEKNHACRLF
jgi:2-polyprenyl-6-methoxyphenol hydroxylase-like FAD-dependent oxidoreductase